MQCVCYDHGLTRIGRLIAYFVAKVLSEMPFQLFFPTLFVLIVYYMIGFKPIPSFLLLFLAIVYSSTLASST